MLNTLKRYNILKFKMKLSYCAFLNNKTLKELWLGAMLNTLDAMKRTKQFNGGTSVLNCQEKYLID